MSELRKIPTGIRSVAFFRDGTGRCCDRCGTFIKNVALVTTKDGSSLSYGSECIEKILSGDTSLQSLWNKNFKLLQKFQRHLEILNLPADQMPVGKRAINERPGDTTRFIAENDKGSWMCHDHYYFHPGVEFRPTNLDGQRTFDMRKMGNGKTYYEAYTVENWDALRAFDIEQGKQWVQVRITRISAFLSRVLEKGLVTQPKQ
jgi:hypothetical protein